MRPTPSSPATIAPDRPRLRAARFVARVMCVRLGGAALATAITTLLAVQSRVPWLPLQDVGLSGLASLGLVGVGGTVGGLLANSVGSRFVHRRGVRVAFLLATVTQVTLLGVAAVLIATVGLPRVGMAGLALILFLGAVGSPAVAGLSRHWWGELGLPVMMAKRGAALESTFAAIAWSVGPVVAAPLVLLTPWVIPVFWLLIVMGLLSLLGMPSPVVKTPVAGVTRRSTWRGWWLPGTYSFYHIARALLNGGLTAVLLGAHQQTLIGAAGAGPSLGHTVGGILFVTRGDPTARLRRAALMGLLGQALPTLLLAGVFWVLPRPGLVATALLVVGGGVLIGVLKAPVAAVIYPMAATVTPHLTVVEATSMITNGMIVGGLIGPLLATLIIITVGPGWLLMASVVALMVCMLGVLLQPAGASARTMPTGVND